MTGAGIEIVTFPDKKPFQDAVKPVWDKFAPTPELKALVQKVVNTK